MSLIYTASIASLVFLVLPMSIESKLIYLAVGFTFFWMSSVLVLLIYLYLIVGDILISISQTEGTAKDVSDEQ